ncbi:Fur family transcriptional regulator [Microbacterium sp.]|uniref:Fur family transcriptional regulator n=1 Tax=Microbacterium sp. TaxID=51671 RepID=UPI003A836025
MATDTAGIDTALRGAGLRATAGRAAVWDALGSGSHLSADQVFRLVTTHLPKTSIQSVHNVLTDLTDAGLIRRIEPAGSPARYERRVGDNHHHVVCTACGAVGDVDCSVGHTPCLTPSSTQGFQIQSAEVTYWGLCPACQANTGP